MASSTATRAISTAVGTANLKHVQATRHLRPRCKAKSKTTGERCRQMAMSNGCCYYHGGRTPKGKDWHKKRWKISPGPRAERRLAVKLSILERKQRVLAKRLAQMSPDERARYDAWHRARPIGTPEFRAARTAARKQDQATRRLSKSPCSDHQEKSSEILKIEDRIADLRAQLDHLRKERHAAAPLHEGANTDQTGWDIFG